MVSEKLWQDAIEEIQILRRRVQELEQQLRERTTEVLDIDKQDNQEPLYRGHHTDG